MLSLSADLGLGQPMGHLARSCLIAIRFGARIGLTGEDLATTYSLALLAWVGCMADSHETSARFGDDIDLRAEVYDVEIGSPPMLGYLVRKAGSGGSLLHRARVRGELIGTMGRVVQESLVARCQVTGQLAARLGMDDRLRRCLAQTFTRWDGRGSPAGIGGEDIDVATRIVRLADVVEVRHRRDGVEAALDVTRRLRGSTLDPAIADAFARLGGEVLDGLPAESSWSELLATDPAPRPLSGTSLDAVADFVDLKSPWFAGRSRGVADLAAAAARRAGLGPEDLTVVRRAGLLHGLGRSGVPNTIWDKAGPLTDIERGRVELHSYYTDWMLRRLPALGPAAGIAAMAHERIDGSGYHRGLSGAAIPITARILAAADCYHAMTEARPHRPALTRLPPRRPCAGRAASMRRPSRPCWAARAPTSAARPPVPPASPPARCRCWSCWPAPRRPAGSASSWASHRRRPATIERIYVKIGASTRAGAALLAVQHGLLSTLVPLEA